MTCMFDLARARARARARGRGRGRAGACVRARACGRMRESVPQVAGGLDPFCLFQVSGCRSCGEGCSWVRRSVPDPLPHDLCPLVSRVLKSVVRACEGSSASSCLGLALLAFTRIQLVGFTSHSPIMSFRVLRGV